MLTAEPEEVSTGGVEHLRWSVSSDAADVVVRLDGDLDLATVGEVGRLLGKIVERRPGTIALDATNLSFLDSTGIHCLVNAAEAASRVGSTLVLRNPSASVVRVLGICGVDELLLDAAGRDATARR
jgi:anti-sigma B factor antagonist